MKTTILSFEADGKCDFSRKQREVVVVQIGDAAPQRVLTTKLLEILRWNSSLLDAANDRSVSTVGRQPQTQKGDAK